MTVTCTDNGDWTGGTPVCECNTGYQSATNADGVEICQG